jgi:1-acyl-sn-glycerol-3-phosphate acyltransferase
MNNNLRRFGYVLLHRILFRINEYNKKDLTNKTYLLCPNHTSDFDGPVLWTSNENIRIMAKKECFKNPIMGAFFRKINIVSVDRSKHSGTEIKEAVRYLEEKDNSKIFMMFPQGTISDINKNALSRIKPGAFFIAALSKTPIIPVFIEQPRILRRSRIMYGNEINISDADVYTDKGTVDKEKLIKFRELWQQEILRLQEEATRVEDRPIRKIKLNEKHRNANI